MDDLFRLLPVLLIYFLVLSSGSKKKKKADKSRRSSPMRTSSRGERHDMRARTRTAQTAKGFPDAFVPEKNVSEGIMREAMCEGRPVHLHEVTQQQMEHAQEGEDPCHAGGFDTSAAEAHVAAPDAENLLAQDVLRGVIMSEILLRPQERRALQRKRYHG